MLWNEIYLFFVKYVFGGYSFEIVNNNFVFGEYDALFNVDILDSDTRYAWQTANVKISMFGLQMPLGNYLSFIATIITLVAILLFCVFIIKKIIGIIFRLFTGSSAF